MFTVYLTLSIYSIAIQQYSTEVNRCSSQFLHDDGKLICIHSEDETFSWISALNQCRTQSTDAKPLEIVTVEQFTWLKKTLSNEKTTFWLGANNFLAGKIPKWSWLTGLEVDARFVKWCDGIDSDRIRDFQCLAYESQLNCVRNYACHTLLPVLCVSDSLSKIQMKTSGREQALTRSTFNLCASSFGDTYANWWTYSVLLLNWFFLLCFFLNLCNRFILERNTMIFAFVVALFSFIIIVIFASLWGVQYQDLNRIPLIIVIFGCISGIAMLLVVVIILFNRNRVQRWTICMVILCGSWIAELFLMLGIILCIADCSGYVDLASTLLEKDIIASLLATLVTAISILCQAALTYIMQTSTQDRPNVVKPVDVPPNTMPLVRRPTPVHQQSQIIAPNNVARTTSVPLAPPKPKAVDVVERSTSPVDYRILAEFYSDPPQDVHSYSLDGREYRVYEGHFHDIESYRKDLVEAMLIQSSDGLRDAIRRAKSSMHARELHEEIEQAETLASKIT